LRKRFERAPNGVVPKETLKAAGIGGRGTCWLRDANARVYVRALLVGKMDTPVATAPVMRLVSKP
jgi:hypothetical protein